MRGQDSVLQLEHRARQAACEGRDEARNGLLVVLRVPEVEITITEAATGERRVAQTNDTRLYAAPSLRPDPYSIAVQHEGFRTIMRSGLQLQVDQQLRVDFGSVANRVLRAGMGGLSTAQLRPPRRKSRGRIGAGPSRHLSATSGSGLCGSDASSHILQSFAARLLQIGSLNLQRFAS